MSTTTLPVAAALHQRYLLDYPYEAARVLEAMAPADSAELLAQQPAHAAVRAWQALGPDVARAIVDELPDAFARSLLSEATPAASAAV
ncbi:MAG: hypothetical protein ABI547_05130, partial [Betaproteobacteria bacterium]